MNWKCLCKGGESHGNAADFMFLFGRMFIGFSMAFAHGWGKIPPPEWFVGFVGKIGFPGAIAFAWLAALSEFLGGIFVGLGLFTRLGSLMIAGTMAVAGLMAHAADPFQKKELALMYLAASLIIFAVGAGKHSADTFLTKKK